MIKYIFTIICLYGIISTGYTSKGIDYDVNVCLKYQGHSYIQYNKSGKPYKVICIGDREHVNYK